MILEGLEHSLGENLTRNFEVTDPGFFTDDEQQRALRRIHEDIGEPTLQIDDVAREEILQYLDLGDLVGLMGRHASSAKSLLPEDVKRAIATVNASGALSIRKRVMHPVRPLELDDFEKLSQLAREIQKVAPSLNWSPLAINLRRMSKEEFVTEDIPAYWAEEPPIIHNLPPAEFDETGFIGRRKERKDLKRLLDSEHRVITVVGEGGIGKTALSLRVCNDLLEENSKLFDKIMWVSLKTRYLTPEGIRDIQNAVDSPGYLIQTIARDFTSEEDNQVQQGWSRVIEQMRQTKTLLVIDNLETIGERIRDLALEIPLGSKLLLTSRVGLGEIEVRYELSSFASEDAMALFRSLANIHNFKSLMGISNKVVHSYIGSLHFNPLLIKWFVLGVGKGADPNTLLKGKGLEEALMFCYENVYERLGELEKNILAIIMAARRYLTNAQLMELTDTESVALVRASQDLVRSSMIQRVMREDGSIALQLGGLVYEYLTRTHPPNNSTVLKVRARIKEWQVGQDKIAVQSVVYRYGWQALQVTSEDEHIAAQYIVRAFSAIRVADLPAAESAVSKAEQITPTWWEVYRVKARLLELQNRPIFEVENAYEQSIRCNDNDVNQYHYAAYLNKNGEYERALDHIEAASRCKDAQSLVLKSLRGLILMRMGQSDEAAKIMMYVWENRSKKLPATIGRIQGTQLAEAYRRSIEQLKMKGMAEDVIGNFSMAANVIGECINSYGCDDKLVEIAVHLFSTVESVLKHNGEQNERALEIAKRWDNNSAFRTCVAHRSDTLQHFARNPDLADYFPRVATTLSTTQQTEPGQSITKGHYSGTIHTFVQRQPNPYGFVSCEELGSVYFNAHSLVNASDWHLLKEGISVNFDIIATKKPYSPCAIRLQLDFRE
jgi:LuxR family glucitol operon transcriptional activator